MMINGRYIPAWKFEHLRGVEHFGKAEREHRAMLSLIDAITAKSGEITRDRNLTDVGKKTALREFVIGAAVPLLKNARTASKAARERSAARRSELLPARRAKDDLAGAILAGEIRAHLRAMDPAKRSARIRMAEFSPEELHAIVELPGEYSGITDEQRLHILDQSVIAANPDAAKEVSDLNDAADSVDEAVRAVTLTISGAGINERELAQLLGENFVSTIDRMRSAEANDADDLSDITDERAAS